MSHFSYLEIADIGRILPKLKLDRTFLHKTIGSDNSITVIENNLDLR